MVWNADRMKCPVAAYDDKHAIHRRFWLIYPLNHDYVMRFWRDHITIMRTELSSIMDGKFKILKYKMYSICFIY